MKQADEWSWVIARKNGEVLACASADYTTRQELRRLCPEYSGFSPHLIRGKVAVGRFLTAQQRNQQFSSVSAALRSLADATGFADQPTQDRVIMPGQMCRHNKSGGLYVVVMRRLAYAPLFEGETLVGELYRATVTDQVYGGEQIVIYRREIDNECFARPARLFDEPGRFSHALPAPVQAGKGQ